MKNIIALLGLCLIANVSIAEVTLPAIFSDNMVLQQQMEAPIWGWATPNATVKITTSWDDKEYTAAANSKGEWKTKMSTPEAGGPYTISISDGEQLELENVLIGEVWLCSGQSNMEMPLKGFPGQPILGGNEAIVNSKNDRIRLITVPRKSTVQPQDNFEGKWEEAAPKVVSNFSATAWFFGKQLYDALDVPIGLVHVSWGGSSIEAWMSEQMLADFKEEIKVPQSEDEIDVPNRTATALYNGMITPVAGYGMRGAIWYQGESNNGRPDQYEELMVTMVREWRSLWGEGEFPFYYAQIAPFDYGMFSPNEVVEKNNSAYLRDAQRKAMDRIPNSGMAVLMDIGEKENIHPADKKAGGHRLAYWALAETYGIEGFEYKGPAFEAMEVKGSTVIVAFENVPVGITSYGKEVTSFELAGEDKKFYPATAVLRRKSVMLSSPQVDKPVAVRYAFEDFVVGEIFSTGGIPMSSFRTDDW
ncbi:sialate O-acetylesterase [Echinicola strongylocentroti]|uniref:Sialate O-acetylesterase n=1 Tax=Echinicola strongylocentroti TaxID=1795355 RepID=A0A2Z4IQR3_9BACT|nr:sialate O-acetylesterase [Echinicola strongylocentroti]AWW33197.1 sialate O-acetylesterase [Echinicola strongylocentroti]